jgi:hypothetical protein
VWCIYKLHKSKILKARGLQNITKTLTISRLWTDVWVTVQTEAQWVHNSENRRPFGALCTECAEKEVLLAHNALNARLWDEIPVHVLIRVGGGGILSGILLLQLQT